MSRATKTAALAVTILAWAVPASSQSKTTWQFAVTPYVWMAGLDGEVGIRDYEAHLNVGFTDVLKALRFAAMGYGEARYGKHIIGLDAIYLSIGDVKTAAIRGITGTLQLTQHEWIVHPTVGFAFGDESGGVDILGGARYWNLRAHLDLDGTRRDLVDRSASRRWVDATGGARLHWMPASYLQLIAAGDAGGGGSRATWQAYGSVGARIWRNWTAALAYRYLSVDYDHDGFLYDTNMMGFQLSATYKF